MGTSTDDSAVRTDASGAAKSSRQPASQPVLTAAAAAAVVRMSQAASSRPSQQPASQYLPVARTARARPIHGDGGEHGKTLGAGRRS